MPRYNDYELIYLITSEKCENSLKLMFRKYSNMIYKFLHLYNVEQRNFDDYYQECLILLNHAIDIFDESRGKTFTRFYELIVRRKIFELKRKEAKYELRECLGTVKDSRPYIDYDEIDLSNLTSFEQTVFNKHYIENQKIQTIALNENKSSKQIYNAIYRIKTKYKNNML